MNEAENLIYEWINTYLCKGEDKDLFFKAALLFCLDRIADALEDINRSGIYTY